MRQAPSITRPAGTLTALAMALSLLLGACASTTPARNPRTQTLAPVGPALDALARQLIERVERESNCRYLLAGRTAPSTAGAAFTVVLLSYRGPEIECRQGLELLNHHGALRGVAFVADRLRLALAPQGALSQPLPRHAPGPLRPSVLRLGRAPDC